MQILADGIGGRCEVKMSEEKTEFTAVQTRLLPDELLALDTWRGIRSRSMALRELVRALPGGTMPGGTRPVCHILRSGLALCGAGMPQDWPKGQRWIPESGVAQMRAQGGLCAGCDAGV